ncbi:hypothetical protein ACWCXB_31025 [Streptomyces sp. NPDC001514]
MATPVAAGVVFVLRMTAICRRLSLPTSSPRPPSERDESYAAM